MKNNFILVHGSFGNPYANWFKWLNEELENRNYNCLVPSFPVGVGYQNYNNWSKLLKYYFDLGFINETTTLIGHSIAPIFIAKFLIENNIKVKKLIYVSGFNNYLGINEEYDNVNKTMFIDNLEELRNYCNDIICLYSNNDPYLPLEVLESFANIVATEKIMIYNGGHLNSESGYNSFKELLKHIS